MRDRARQCYRKVETWLEQRRTTKLFLQLCPQNTRQSLRSAGQQRKTVPNKNRAASCLPDEPIHNCELDVETGDYYCPHCPFGSGPVASNPWEAMIHEVAHFAEPEEVEEMRKEYEANLAAREENECEDPPRDTPTSSSRPFNISLFRTLIVFGTCLVCWIVWPTPYRYDHIGDSGVSVPVRINRITGKSERLTMNGWVDMAQPTQSSRGNEESLSQTQIAKLHASDWNFGPSGSELYLSVYNGSDFDIREITVNLDVRYFRNGKLIPFANQDYRIPAIAPLEPQHAGVFEAFLGPRAVDPRVASCKITGAEGMRHMQR